MEDTDDSISMIPKSDKKPYRMKTTKRLFHENITFGSGVDADQVNVTHRETEHRQMSLKLTIVILLVLVSTLVFLVLFLIVPLFYNLNHPIASGAGSHGSHVEETLERGHSHSSVGSEEHANHDGMKEVEETGAEHSGHDRMKDAEETDADKMLNMENQKTNSKWIKQISGICPCFAKLVNDGKSESELEITTADVETCLRNCFSSAPTTAEQRSPTPGPPVMPQQQPENSRQHK